MHSESPPSSAGSGSSGATGTENQQPESASHTEPASEQAAADAKDSKAASEAEEGDHVKEQSLPRKSHEERTVSEAEADEAIQEGSTRTSSFERVPSDDVPFGQRRACEPCHLAKVRCKSEVQLEVPCERCRKRGIPCEFPERHRGRRQNSSSQGQGTTKRVRISEGDEAADYSHGSGSLENSPGPSPPRPTAAPGPSSGRLPVPEMFQNPRLNAEAIAKWVEALPHITHPVEQGALEPDAPPQRFAHGRMSFPVSPKGTAILPHPAAIHKRTISEMFPVTGPDGRRGSVISSGISSPHFRPVQPATASLPACHSLPLVDDCDPLEQLKIEKLAPKTPNPLGEGNDNYVSRPNSNETMQQDSTSSRPNAPQQATTPIAQSGIFSDLEIDIMVGFYFRHLNPCTALLPANQQRLTTLRKDSSNDLLLLVLCSVTAQFVRPEKYEQIMELVRQGLTSIASDTSRATAADVQALCLLAMFRTPAHLHIHRVTAVAIQCAIHLGLDQLCKSETPGHAASLVNEGRRTQTLDRLTECQRLWFLLVKQDIRFSMRRRVAPVTNARDYMAPRVWIDTLGDDVTELDVRVAAMLDISTLSYSLQVDIERSNQLAQADPSRAKAVALQRVRDAKAAAAALSEIGMRWMDPARADLPCGPASSATVRFMLANARLNIVQALYMLFCITSLQGSSFDQDRHQHFEEATGISVGMLRHFSVCSEQMRWSHESVLLGVASASLWLCDNWPLLRLGLTPVTPIDATDAVRNAAAAAARLQPTQIEFMGDLGSFLASMESTLPPRDALQRNHNAMEASMTNMTNTADVLRSAVSHQRVSSVHQFMGSAPSQQTQMMNAPAYVQPDSTSNPGVSSAPANSDQHLESASNADKSHSPPAHPASAPASNGGVESSTQDTTKATETAQANANGGTLERLDGLLRSLTDDAQRSEPAL